MGNPGEPPILPASASNGVRLLKVPAWRHYDWLWHGFSTRQFGTSRAYRADNPEGDTRPGELNLGFTATDLPDHVRENRYLWAEAVTGSRETPLRTIRQVHSGTSVTATANAPEFIPEADGILTILPGTLLSVMTADCIPVLVTDPERRAVGAFHAGWRGTAAQIVELGIAQMAAEFGSDPGQMSAAIGPGIGACCYKVGAEVREQFDIRFSYAEQLFATAGAAFQLDLIEANRRQLLSAGLQPGNIATVGGCTGCHPDWFYSHRASGGNAGRMMASIGIRMH